ncbi:hypothetical protein SAMN05421839_11338 [Halolactibacillus halophilus]|uniref:LysM domain-containing protein n=1 Tax=Halolactibacillus halophilus TaxID=306540 RepID=A0A1I5P838_9BACI|nr:hypothetical protein [Halolactibacillus halophilus]GEM01670.1 hypothetical protein HHA03_12020 [Halolactibacillus halophilus]SFP30268.1 hypothetical protein SAMN05421839_11338 [Halolactibacillus halophilus]
MTSQQDDQAKALRQRFENSTQNIGKPQVDTYHEDDHDDEMTANMHQEGVDVLSLPPRSRLHEEKKKKVRLKISYAMIRLMVISFILLVILLLTFPYWKDTFFSGSNQEVIHAQFLDHSSDQHDARFRLSNEIERTVEIETGETATYQGRLYISLEGETLTQIVDRFYDNQVMMNRVQTINDVSTRTEIIPEGTRLFLPDMKK